MRGISTELMRIPILRSRLFKAARSRRP
ncbi:MAG: hypothetical protein JWM11_4637, partial [Planctomycetaceae bacterium]|nr:hypothetical protein [Planctomycetaceae bacterium]